MSPLPPKQKEQISVRVTVDQLARVDAIAEKKRTTRNAVVRYALELGLKAVELEIATEGRGPA